MAGIGFSLRELARSDDVMGSLRAFMHATLVASGPWLVTILALGALSVVAEDAARNADVSLFRLIVIYNFGFSLVCAGPISIVVTRYLADRIYLRDASEGPGMLLGSTALMLATQAPIAITFYGFFVDAPFAVRLVAVAGYLLTGALWVAAVFLSTLKDFRTITWSFFLGMAAGLVLGAALSDMGALQA